MPGLRIEHALPMLPLGSLFKDRATYSWYVYIGRRKNTAGLEYYFVREGRPDWVYKCSMYDTLCTKFVMPVLKESTES